VRILRFVFVSVPTAALATAVVVGVSQNGQSASAIADGDLQRDLKLASSTGIELAPLGRPLATVSSIEVPPSATPERRVRTKRSTAGPRAVRSRTPVVRAAPEPEVAESIEESEATETTALADAAAEATATAPAEGGVALPRPSAIPVSYPAPGAGTGTGSGDSDGGWGGTVIRGGGGVFGGDPCRVHTGGTYGRRPVYRQPRGGGISLGDRVSGAQGSRSERPRSMGERVRTAQGRSGSQAASSRGSLGSRVRAAQGRSR
jgi:hypothetical protein